MATRKKPEERAQELEVRNLVVFRWIDEEDNVHEYNKRLRKPKGRKAREFMPRVLRFLGEVADKYSQADAEDEQFSSSTADIIAQFFTHENEDLFVYILQVDEDDEEGRRILEEEMNSMDTLDVVIQAAQYLVSESLNRTEVQQALKKSDGDETQEEEEAPASK